MKVKEYVAAALFACLPDPERYTLERKHLSRRVSAGAGVTANLVSRGLAEFIGPSTWIADYTDLGMRVREAAE